MRIRYEGKIRGFLAYALPELRKAAEDGLTLQKNARQIQRRLREAQTKDLCSQACRGPKTVA